jgi:hypothetical protein
MNQFLATRREMVSDTVFFLEWLLYFWRPGLSRLGMLFPPVEEFNAEIGQPE